MSNAATSAENRPLSLRRRPDLRPVEQRLAGERLWAVKDPASLKYFHLSEEERFLFEQLDGQTSLEEIQNRFETRFVPRRISLHQLHAFIGMLHREGLLLGDTRGQADVLMERRREQERRERWSRLASLLAIRFRGFDPQPLLNWLYPRCRWMFSRAALTTAGVLVLAAIALVAVHWREVTTGLPEFKQFLGSRNLLWLAVTVAGVKVLHELGHALTLKHFGGECHEIGPMLLLCVPCLYCNTTDAWMLGNKWQRAAVAAAGIGVEVVLAAIATFLWWWSESGLFNALCLDVMIVCSVSTVFFNGNPLLRYDGYYILSDLVETPNLAQQAAEVVHGSMAKWFLGLHVPTDRLYRRSGQSRWLAAYWFISTAYRLFVIAMIVWGLHQVLLGHRLDVLVGIFVVSAVAGLVAMPTMRALRFVRNPTWRDRVNLQQFSRRGMAVLIVGLLLLFFPLPARVSAPAVIRPADADRVYVTVPGTIVETRQPGDAVSSGDMVARLRNSEILLATEKARGECDRQRLHVENLKRQAVRSTAAAEEIPTAEAALKDLEKRLTERLADELRLTIIAPSDGFMIVPPTEQSQAEESALESWEGSPLDPHNHGAYLKTGTLVCFIGNPAQLEALALIDQGEIDLVQPGQRVSLLTDLYPGRRFEGEVTELSPSRVDELPRELMAAGDLPQHSDAGGHVVPLHKIYQARIKLDQADAPLLIGGIGNARIHVASRSLAARLMRFLDSTFRVKW